MTLANLQDSLVSPQAVRFWDRNSSALRTPGFPRSIPPHLHRLLATPLLLSAMVLMAAALTLG